MAGSKTTIISVVMSVYNCAPYLSKSIDCLLRQTFTSWELIICDDGSTDDTYFIAKTYKKQYPDRIRLIRLRKNFKQAVARNLCIERAVGKYVAIMDGDDTCDSERLEREYRYLEKHPDADFVGTGMRIFDENGYWGISIPKVSPSRRDFIMGSSFCAATCLFRREALRAVGGYRAGKKYWRLEDMDLFIRLYAAGFKGANIQEPLYNYREYQDVIKRRNLRTRISSALYVRDIVRLLELPVWMNVYGLKILILGLLPRRLYTMLHRWKYKDSVIREN